MLFRGKRLGAYPVYLLLEGATSLFLGITYAVNLVYQVQTAHLNALQLVLIGTALEGSIFLLQVPTGMLADVYSRRRSILVGIFFLGLGGLTQGAFASFEAILLSSVLAGIGFSFLIGAEEAWIAGEVGEERAGHVFLRGGQVAQVGSLVGVLVGTGLGALQLNLPLLVGGALLVALSLALTLIMPEHHFQQSATAGGGERPTWSALTGTLRQGVRLVRRSPVLLTILAIAAFAGMSSEGFDRLNVAHFLQDFTVPPFGPLNPVVWFGAMSAMATLLSLGAMELTRRALNLTRSVVVARALLVLQSLLMLAVIVFGLAGSFPMAVATFLVVKVLRQVSGPLEVTWLTQHTTPEVRATVISMSGQMDAFGQIAGGPIIGGIGLGRSVRAALITTGAVLAPALVLYARTLRKGYLTPVEVTAGVAEETAAAMVEAPGV